MRITIVAIAVLFPAMAYGQDAPPGALSCTGCHDPSVETVLSLKGRSAADIVSAMNEIRDGARETTLMGRIAAGFTEAEITDIADWIAGESRP